MLLERHKNERKLRLHESDDRNLLVENQLFWLSVKTYVSVL
jgi:hypothetical protein